MFDKIKNALGNAGDAGNLGDLKKYVEGINFPASKDEIISQLQENGAQDDLIAKVKGIAQEQFKDPQDLLANFMDNR